MSNDVAPEVHFFWGPPGSGKTREVYSLEPDVYKVSPSDKYKWFDGYYGQPAVLFDNITPQNISPVDLLIAIDRYYSEMPRKGGFVGWRPQRIYLTTVYPIDVIANGSGFSHPSEFLRRVTHVRAFTSSI